MVYMALQSGGIQAYVHVDMVESLVTNKTTTSICLVLSRILGSIILSIPCTLDSWAYILIKLLRHEQTDNRRKTDGGHWDNLQTRWMKAKMNTFLLLLYQCISGICCIWHGFLSIKSKSGFSNKCFLSMVFT